MKEFVVNVVLLNLMLKLMTQIALKHAIEITLVT